MSVRRSPVYLLVSLAVLAAGCLDAAPAKVNEVAHDAMDGHSHNRAVSGTFHMEATDCEEAGWIATYGGTQTFAKVWKSDDIRGEYNNPLHDSNYLPTPLIEPMSGNHHIGFTCKSATVDGETQADYKFGFVGEQIQAPPWDPGGADRHILIGGMSFKNGTFGDALRATTTADITHTLDAYTTWSVPRDETRSVAYSLYHDMEKGVYETTSTLERSRTVPERTVRFWWQVPADGSDAHIWTMDHDHDGAEQPEGMKWNPVYWDMHTTAGGQWVSPKEGVGLQEHNFNINPTEAEHFPWFSQQCMATFYEHPSLTFTSGHVFTDVTIDDLWAH